MSDLHSAESRHDTFALRICFLDAPEGFPVPPSRSSMLSPPDRMRVALHRQALGIYPRGQDSMAATAQSEAALDRANKVRLHRAALKREIKACRLRASKVIGSEDPLTEEMEVIDVLMAIPRVGRFRATKWLSRCQIAPSKRLGALTERQRSELLALLP